MLVRAPWAERRQIRLCPQVLSSAAVLIWIGKCRLFYLSLPHFVLLMQSHPGTGGDMNKGGGVVAAAGREVQ